jgi:cysteine desulfurase/selenocysteine lyase
MMGHDTRRPTTLTGLRNVTPALDSGRYFNYGAHGPSPRHVVAAAEDAVRAHEYTVPVHEDPYEVAFAAYDETRERIASFVGAAPEEIALTESTTAGITAVANALDWEPGDVVVRTDFEHPAGVLPWQRLEEEGVEVRVVETEDGRIDEDGFAEAVADAKLVCFSALTWTYGTVLPVSDLVDIAHEAGALVLVDAVQVPGQRPLDVTDWGADIVAAAGHKWLLGVWGSGFLYIDSDVVSDLRPRAVGYRSVEEPMAEEFAFAPGARRFEIGSANLGPYAALREAIDTIEGIGVGRIADSIEALTTHLVEGIPDDRLHSPAAPESGLVVIDVDDPQATVERLAERNIIVRAVPEPAGVRASVHAVNTEADVAQLLDALESEWD